MEGFCLVSMLSIIVSPNYIRNHRRSQGVVIMD